MILQQDELETIQRTFTTTWKTTRKEINKDNLTISDGISFKDITDGELKLGRANATVCLPAKMIVTRTDT